MHKLGFGTRRVHRISFVREAILPTLDRIDRTLLTAVQNNARASNKELAAIAGLAPSSCLARMKRLVADGVIRGWHA
jgi:DNA-binding Lrp family transcriptional regulator